MSLKYGISVRFDDDVRDLAAQFPRAAVAVLNRGVTTVSGQVVKNLHSEFNLPKSLIKKRIYVRKATKNSLWATIRFSQRGINPYWFLKKKKPTVHQEPVILEIKRGSSMFPGNKIFANIGRGSGKLKLLSQPDSQDRSRLPQMKYIKGANVFKTEPITTMIKNYIEPYLQKELPRVIEAWYKSGKDFI